MKQLEPVDSLTVPTSGVAAAALQEVYTPDPELSVALEILNAAKSISVSDNANSHR